MPTMGQLAVPGSPLHRILQRRLGGGMPAGAAPPSRTGYAGGGMQPGAGAYGSAMGGAMGQMMGYAQPSQMMQRPGAYAGIPGGRPAQPMADSARLGLNMGLDPMQRNAFRSAALGGNLNSYLGAHPMLQQRFDTRMQSGQYGQQAQSYLGQNMQHGGQAYQPLQNVGYGGGGYGAGGQATGGYGSPQDQMAGLRNQLAMRGTPAASSYAGPGYGQAGSQGGALLGGMQFGPQRQGMSAPGMSGGY